MSGADLVNVDIPFDVTGVTIAGRWHPNDAERRAAWELCVEFSTRIALVPLREGEGLLTEALGSLHEIFGATRSILRAGGPDLAVDRRGELSFAVLAGHLLNQVLRPVTAFWHPQLKAHMDLKPPDMTSLDREHAWSRYADLRELLDEIRQPLTGYAEVFAQACGAQEFLHVQLDYESRLYEQFRRDQARKGH